MERNGKRKYNEVGSPGFNTEILFSLQFFLLKLSYLLME